MKVVILCGGKGTRLEQETEWRPKPMVEIGGIPILVHIMNIYAHFGFKDFVLCLGHKGDAIRDYFLNYRGIHDDVCIDLKSGGITQLGKKIPEWKIILAETGANAQTGARIKKIEKYIDTDHFLMTYGDAVANVDIKKLYQFHQKHGKTATVTGIYPSYRSRFGEVHTKLDKVTKFTEKPVVYCSELTNGGFFVFSKKVFKYLSSRDDCVFEKKPLEKLTSRGELCLYKHKDFWHCMDTPRDLAFLNNLCETGHTPWSFDQNKRNRKKTPKVIFDAHY